MREIDLLDSYPQPQAPRSAIARTFSNRLIASERGREFFDGDRANGYGGLNDDGRWGKVAERMAQEYSLNSTSCVLQINAEKGFLLREFQSRGIAARGTEESQYALENSAVYLDKMPPNFLRYGNKTFDLVLALGPVYVQNLPQAVQVLREIARVGRHAFVTLASFESEEDLKLLRSWSLLGTTILRREEWLEVLAFAGYNCDYKFVTAKSLGLL